MSTLPKVEITKIHTYTGHKDAVYTIEPGGEDHLFYSSGGDGHVIEWDLHNYENGRLIAKVDSSVYALCYVPEHDILIVGQNYEGIHLIRLSDRSEAGSLQLGKLAIYDIQYTQGLILVACAEGEFFIIDMKSLKVLKRSVMSEKNLREILVIDDRCFVGASDGQIIRVDLKSFEIENQTMVHEKSVFGLAHHVKDQVLLTASRDARLKYWDVSQQENELESINAHMYAINDVVFRPDYQYFATASMDKTIKIWDYEQRRLIKVIDKARHGGHLTSVNKLIWSGFKQFLISCSDDRSISVWDINIAK
ncbi:WD domain-containing protein, G-beta repeat-containing protein [Reichenbachiella agariperforans]|uniref:WD domain-containing protein, G-beta repeat-containing protein n=1 Tax=Reichenbachiella agariperforans TaxID=156994 RepID=A0A1M6M3A8_REIAG|nr:WD40 repeat domain-containing protein [Reichenbachiella agariperforans]SHJ77905.1 WD domain-containing protein, G-beta repeat-containing protein [Reichenbachiella agariperforans]